MKLQLIAALVAAMFVGSALAQGGGAQSTSASSTSITGARVSISGNGAAAAGAYDKSGAVALSYSGSSGCGECGGGYHSFNFAAAKSEGASWAAGTHSGSGYTDAGAFEYSHAEARAGDRRRRSHSYND